MPDGRIVCYQNGDIVTFEGDYEILRFSLYHSFKECSLGRFKTVNRLLRLGIRTAVAIDESTIVLSIGSLIYELNVKTGVLSQGYHCSRGTRPLVFSLVKGVGDIADGLYYGEYHVNMGKCPISIYHRIGLDKWEVVYTFPQGAINHVHNIIADPYRNCLWVFTGDFDEAAAIWRITDDFKKVERVVCNNQKYRACVVFPLPDGLLYATDSPFTDNYIYLLNPDTYLLTELFPIDGSCIYGCKWNNQYVFSTTVEGDGRDETLLKLLFSRKRGAGIKDDYAHLYVGDDANGFQEIYKERKDGLPFLFQYGVFRFPCGDNNTNWLYFQPIATNINDLFLMSFTK